VSPVRPQWFYTYALISERDSKFYTGAHDPKKRIREHNAGLVQSTRQRMPLRLVYFEACRDKNDAYRRERYLKSGMGKRYLRNRFKGGLTG
jgi:putative endonuclease